ncbi:MAG: hypothetical protein KDK78_01900, partial [Chlamydiia bacterium]|nr:hypothetical protein [Chlamydiia bacterium]
MNGHEQSTQGPRDELLLSLRDLWQIIRKKKRMILLCGLILSFLSCMLTFQKGIVYEAEAMFREREKRGAGLSSSFTDLLGFGGRGGAQSEAEAMMQSRQVIEPIVRKHHLQASITDLGKKRGRLHRIYDHIKVQLAHLKRQKTPCLADPDPDLVCTSVEYQGECPK